MTDEEIKQNAEWYSKAISNPNFNWRDDDNIASVAFIAGAHSRDEEIEELKNKIKSIEEDRRICITNLLKECDRLRKINLKKGE